MLDRRALPLVGAAIAGALTLLGPVASAQAATPAGLFLADDGNTANDYGWACGAEIIHDHGKPGAACMAGGGWVIYKYFNPTIAGDPGNPKECDPNATDAYGNKESC
jgi:hypothetical protein